MIHLFKLIACKPSAAVWVEGAAAATATPRMPLQGTEVAGTGTAPALGLMQKSSNLIIRSMEIDQASSNFLPSSPAGGAAQRLDVGRRPHLI